MPKIKKQEKEKCPTCHKAAHNNGHLCVPRALSHKKCDWCGAFIPNARHLCADKLKDISYICNSCGRTAVRPEYLCHPEKVS